MRRAWTALWLLTLAVPPVMAAREPILPLGRAGSESAALGGAGVALPGRAEAMFFNPAALAQMSWPEIASGFGNQDLGDLRQFYFAGVMPLYGQLVAGVAGSKLFFAQGDVEDTDQLQVSLAFPLSADGRLLAGFTGKYLSQEFASLGERARGGGVDVGLLFEALRTAGQDVWTLSAALGDAQTILKEADGEETRLPNLYRFGSSFRMAGGTLLVAAFDAQVAPNPAFENFQVLRLGWEQKLPLAAPPEARTRLGYLQRLDQDGLLTAGVGLAWGDLRLDYALQMPVTFQDAFHELSLSWGFQRGERKQAAALTAVRESEEAVPSTPAAESPDSLFSALRSAANMRERVAYVPPPTPTPRPRATPTPPRSPGPAMDNYQYALKVPKGPADMEKTNLAPDLELPGSFSSYISALHTSNNEFQMVSQPLRLHVVVNPFSPNHDGIKDRTMFLGRVESGNLRVARWILNIVKNEQVLRTFKGQGGLPRNLEWDGTDERGRVLPDGDYQVILRVFDDNGLELAGAAKTVKIQTQAETVSLEGPESVTLSGDPKLDQPLVFSVPEAPFSRDWRFSIRDDTGREIFQTGGGGQVPQKLSWPPRVQGRVAPAGRYRAVISYRDEVGLKIVADANFRINYASFGAQLSASPTLFRPGDAAGEGVNFKLKAEGDVKISRWTLKIQGQDPARTVKVFQAQGVPPATLHWDGRDDAGRALTGGAVFRALLTLISAVGTSSQAESQQLQADLGAYTGEKALTINLVRVDFAPDKADLTAEARKSLNGAAEIIQRYKTDYLIRILGHADDREAPNREAELSRNRAQAVADYLSGSQGIPAAKIQVMGYGKEKPVGQGEAESERAKNRSVEVVLYAK